METHGPTLATILGTTLAKTLGTNLATQRATTIAMTIVFSNATAPIGTIGKVRGAEIIAANTSYDLKLPQSFYTLPHHLEELGQELGNTTLVI